MIFEFNGHTRHVDTLAQAQWIWDDYRSGADPDEAGSIQIDDLAEMRGVSQIGNGGTVYEDDRPVATVSYNGRVWDMDGCEITVDGEVAPDLEERARQAATQHLKRPIKITEEVRAGLIAGTAEARHGQRSIVYDRERQAFAFHAAGDEQYSLWAPSTTTTQLAAHWEVFTTPRPAEPTEAEVEPVPSFPAHSTEPDEEGRTVFDEDETVGRTLRALGFYPIGTGGNCVAYAKEVYRNSRVLITSDDGSHLPASMNEPVIIGRYWYDDDGEDAGEWFSDDCPPLSEAIDRLPAVEAMHQDEDRIAAMVAAVKRHAVENYEADGWDFVVECWTDRQIADHVRDCRNDDEAIDRMRRTVAIQAEQRAEAQRA